MYVDFPGSSDDKAPAYNAGDPGSIPGLGRSSGEGNGNPLQYPCLENPMDGGTWWATTVHGIAKSWTQLSDFHFTSYMYVYMCVYVNFFYLFIFSTDTYWFHILAIVNTAAII